LLGFLFLFLRQGSCYAAQADLSWRSSCWHCRYTSSCPPLL
jgi:hypothetical protein